MRSCFYFSFLSFDLSGELENQRAILLIDVSVSCCFFLRFSMLEGTIIGTERSYVVVVLPLQFSKEKREQDSGNRL
jgi:hypothetical protein